MSREAKEVSGDYTPRTQEKKGFRRRWPIWLRQLPRLRFPPPKEDFQLIDESVLEEFFRENNVDEEAAERIRRDIKHMDYELLRLFRARDYDAKYHQNRYRLFQIGYIILATLATLTGSLLALSLNGARELVPVWGFLETVIALFTTYMATIAGREPPLPQWMSHRRRAEYLRREFFRYLMDLEPYDGVQGYEREMLLSERAAKINRGYFPTTEKEG